MLVIVPIASNRLLTPAVKRCVSRLIGEDGSTASGKQWVYPFRYGAEEFREVATLAENRWPVSDDNRWPDS